MLSGALLLGRDISLGDFFKRRFTRIIYPFILYLIIFVVFLSLLMYGIPSLHGLESELAKVPFQYNWFFWMILGIYISIPVINKFIQYSSLKEIEYFVLILFIGSIFYQIMFYLKITQYINLNLFLSPLAYLVLGYYLSVKEFKMSNSKIITLSLILFILTTVIMILSEDGYLPFNYITAYKITSSNYVATLVDIGVLELIRTSCVFLFFKYLFMQKDGIYSYLHKLFENNMVTKFYTSYSRASYGIYLFSRTLMAPLEIVLAGLSLTGSQVCLWILVLIVIVNIACWLIVLLINKIPFIGRFSGYH